MDKLKLSNFLKRNIEEREKFSEDMNKPFGEYENTDNFLKDISVLESSGGKNTDHKVMEGGMHQGQAAVGTFGIMPKTAIDISKKLSNEQANLRQQLPREIILPRVQELKDLSEDVVAERLKNDPHLQVKLARLLAKDLLSRHEGDEERAAYGWNMGSSLKKSNIKDEQLETHPYVNKFRKLRNRLRNPTR